jgi:Fe2+ transport system protein FeoA
MCMHFKIVFSVHDGKKSEKQIARLGCAAGDEVEVLPSTSSFSPCSIHVTATSLSISRRVQDVDEIGEIAHQV